MMLDDQLLAKTRAVAEEVAAAERAALLARAEYHTAIRRLHLAGGSLREIASALEMSHQRVQQIVEAAGGSWWQRVWRTRSGKRDAVCTFCERPPSEVGKLVAGPDVYACDECVARAERALARGGTSGFGLVQQERRVKCSFCGKRSSRERAVLAAKSAAVCAECVRTCREIIDGSAPEAE